MRNSVVAHLKAGCLAVAGILILSIAYLFPVILRAAGEGGYRGVLSLVLVPAASLVVAVAVWLVLYVPVSIVADKMGTTTAARMKWSALLCSVTMLGLGLALRRRFALSIPLLLVASVVVGAGGALYSFFRTGFAAELPVRRESVAVENRYRTFWPRLWAGLVDSCVFLPIAVLMFLAFRDGVPTGLRILCYISTSFAYSAYSVVMHARYGQTVGKMATHVKVLDISEAAITWRQAFLRESIPIALQLLDIALVVPAIASGWSPTRPDGPQPPGLSSWLQLAATFGWFLAELVTMLTNEKRRALHDFIAGTVVVRVTRPLLKENPGVA